MEPHQFDGLTRSAAQLSTRRTLLALALGSAIAWLRRGDVEAKHGHGKGGKGKSGHRTRTVTICHLGQTIRVKKDKALIHLRHGDTIGECPAPASPPPPPGPPPVVCAGLLQSCAVDADCCSTLCSSSNICLCAIPDAQCAFDAFCCSGTCNPATGRCTCHPQGAVCSNSNQCCDGLTCQNIDPTNQLGRCLP
jgi:hypothetical protein